MDLAYLSKHWTKQVEHELTQLFATMGDSWVPHPLADEQDDLMPTTEQVTEGVRRGMDASGIAIDTGTQHH